MESSDESFAWTNASNDNDDETSELPYNMKFECESHDEELHSWCSEENMKKESNGMKAKKRKATSIENNLESPKKKRIKVEPESDVDVKKSKTKIKQDLSNCKVADTDSSLDDSYLNLRVKEEQASDCNIKTKKGKKSKKKRRSIDLQSSDIDESKTKIENVNECEEDSSFVIEDKITIEETVITQPQRNGTEEFYDETFVKHKKKKKKHKRSVSENNDVTNIQMECKNNSISVNETSVTEEYYDSHTEHNVPENGNVDELTENSEVTENSMKTRKVSDRIRFEDDTSDMELTQHEDSANIEENGYPVSKQLKRYIRELPNLQQISTKSIKKKDSIITDMDEVWLLRCPRDIDITQFTGLKIDVSSKSKIKINGKNYDSLVNDSISRLPILSYTLENKPVIKNIKLNACITLRKRLPKVHIPESETMLYDNDFIPLPETKCRHPLFGVNYQKSIKVPARIAKRLQAEDPIVEVDDNVRKKKKKHKKEKRLESDTETQEPIKVEIESVIKKKKGNKRKYSQVEESPPVKKKRVKHNPECAETWESEKAIEETLFNL